MELDSIEASILLPVVFDFCFLLGRPGRRGVPVEHVTPALEHLPHGFNTSPISFSSRMQRSLWERQRSHAVRRGSPSPVACWMYCRSCSWLSDGMMRAYSRLKDALGSTTGYSLG